MAVSARLDRKARTAIAAAIALLLAGPVYLIAKHVSAKLSERSERIVHPEDDQLIILPNGSTMLIKHGSTGRMIADWLKSDSRGEQTFLVGNANFAPGTASLTHDGWEHLAQFAQILKAHPGVTAVVLFSAYHGNMATLQLEHKRADRLHDEALRQGVEEEQIAVAQEGYEPGHNAAADEGLEVVLTNKS